MRHADGPWVLVDASNVARDVALRPAGEVASWARVDAFIHALEHSDIVFSHFYLVADRSLHHLLDAEGQRSLRKMEEAGRAERRRFADETLVELAFSPSSRYFGALIATQDQFDDFRRRYPEIESGDARAIRWNAAPDGTPLLRRQDFGTRTHQRVSRKEEEGELIERRLRREDVQRRAVATYFRCVGSSCLAAQLWPDQLQELPTYDEERDAFVCPVCRGELEVGAKRAPAVQVLVIVDGAERTRILVEEGRDVDIGRSDAKGCIGLERLVGAERSKTVSRRHVRLRFSGTTLTIADLDTKNGTSFRLRRDSRAPARELAPSSPESWLLRDAVLLPGGVTLERSGRRHPLSGERAPESGPTSPQVQPTIAASPRELR